MFEIQVLVDRAPSVSLRQMLERRHLVPRTGRLAEIELHDAALLRQLDLLDLVERLHAALHLSGLRRVRREAIDEPLLLREHRLLPRVGRLAVRLAYGPFALVEVVVARIGRNLAAVDLCNLRDDAVHELAVVRCHQQPAGSRFQKLLEPDDRLDVEVIRRLIHQQDIGLPQQHASHRHAHLPATGQRADVTINPLVVEPEAVQDLTRAALERVPAQMFVLLLHDAEAFERRIHRIDLRRVRHRVLELLELVVQRAQTAAAGDRFVEHRSA